MHLPDIKLLVKLLSIKWERVKCSGCPTKSWVAGIESLKNELDMESKALNVKLTCIANESRELRQFEMALQHKSTVGLFKELKVEVGVGARYANKHGSQECPNCGAIK